MYDLEEDPVELENLAAPDHPRYNDPEVATERDRLAAELRAYRRAASPTDPRLTPDRGFRLWPSSRLTQTRSGCRALV